MPGITQKTWSKPPKLPRKDSAPKRSAIQESPGVLVTLLAAIALLAIGFALLILLF